MAEQRAAYDPRQSATHRPTHDDSFTRPPGGASRAALVTPTLAFPGEPVRFAAAPRSPRPPHPPPGRAREALAARVRDTNDGMVRFDVQLRPEEAARLLEALEISAETRLEGLLAMAEATLRGDKPDRPPIEVMVHVDAATLTGHSDQAGIPAD